MADLSELKSSGSTKIAGATALGVETDFAKVSPNQDLGVSDVCDSGGVEGAISVGTVAVPVRVGASNLANRKVLTAFNNGTSTVYWGFTSSVTPSTGTPLMKSQFNLWEVGPNTTIYMIAAGGSHDVRVTEAA